MLLMEIYNANSSSLRPLSRPKEFYDANDSFIIRLPSNLRASDELEFHIGKDIFNRSSKFANWPGNEVLSRMQRKYCYVPTAPRADMNLAKNPPCSYNTIADASSSNFGTSKDLLPQKRPTNVPPFRTDDITSYASMNVVNGSINHRNWSVQSGSRNNWQASHMLPMNSWSPVEHSANIVGMQNSNDYAPYTEKNSGTYFNRGTTFYCNDYVPNTQKTRGTYYHSENNRFNERNEAFTGSQAGTEPFNEFSNHLSPYKQKKEAQNEYKLKTPEKKERPSGKKKLQGSKLFSLLPVYQNELSLISMLQSRNPKCIIFCNLSSHSRFLHNLPQCLPTEVHLVIYFNQFYKFPLFVSAAIEQFLKMDCLHLHPDSNSHRAVSQHCFIHTINRAHSSLSQDVVFVLLAGDNPTVNRLIRRLVNNGRNTIGFKPNFNFSDFYSALKKCQSNSSSS